PMTSTPESHELQRIVDTWIRYHQGGRDDDFWAVEEIEDTVKMDADDGWPLVTGLIEKAPDELLGTIAAGPLEQLIRYRHREVGDKVLAEARANRRFQDALAACWFSAGELPARLERQLSEV